MNNHYIIIINPLDELPIYNTVLDTIVKYQHSGVKIIDNKISVAYVFIVVKIKFQQYTFNKQIVMPGRTIDLCIN